MLEEILLQLCGINRALRLGNSCLRTEFGIDASFADCGFPAAYAAVGTFAPTAFALAQPATHDARAHIWCCCRFVASSGARFGVDSKLAGRCFAALDAGVLGSAPATFALTQTRAPGVSARFLDGGIWAQVGVDRQFAGRCFPTPDTGVFCLAPPTLTPAHACAGNVSAHKRRFYATLQGAQVKVDVLFRLRGLATLQAHSL